MEEKEDMNQTEKEEQGQTEGLAVVGVLVGRNIRIISLLSGSSGLNHCPKCIQVRKCTRVCPAMLSTYAHSVTSSSLAFRTTVLHRHD